MSSSRKLPLVFYRTPAGQEPVREWLRNLPDADCRAIGLDLMRLQFECIARVLICQAGSSLYALHGFIKKTQKTSQKDIELAKKRFKEIAQYKSEV